MPGIGCDKCPYLTDQACCHQAVRLTTEVTGSDLDIKRKFARIERRSKSINIDAFAKELSDEKR